MTTLTTSPVLAATRRFRLAWITWRQHRVALAGVAIVLGALALILGMTGLRLRHTYAALVRARCPLPGVVATAHCTSLQSAYFHADSPLSSNISAVMFQLSVIPLLIGVFAGAPLLARERETGTFRFSWTQAAGRTRWVTGKLALLGGWLTAAGCAFGALVSWWLPQTAGLQYGSRWQPAQFGLTAVTFAAWTLLAFMLGAFAGALIRRTVPAMAATAACLAVMSWATFEKLDGALVSLSPVAGHATLTSQPVYGPGAPPVTFLDGAAVVPASPAGSWPLRSWITGPHGQMAGFPAVNRLLGLQPSAQNGWLASHHLTLWIAYEPAGRFWVFQSVEGGIGLLLALALGTATVRLCRRWAA